MNYIIWNIRSWFCNHKWNREEQVVEYYDEYPNIITARTTRVSATCNKCGWHKKYNKFK